MEGLYKKCPICGEEREVSLDSIVNICPHSYEGWHIQIEHLLEAAEETPSYDIEKILRNEAHNILITKKPTKLRYKTFEEKENESGTEV